MMSLIGLLLVLILPRNSYAQIVIQPSAGSGGGGGSIIGGTCTNQAMTAIDTSGNVTCTTITSAYVSNTIALTGVDINTSSQVTATHLAAALPFTQGGLGFIVAAVGDLIYASGTTTINKLVDIATGNVLLSGGANTAPAYGKVTSGHVDSSIGLTGSSLAQFASTTSAELAGVISNETGSGALVFGTSPTIGSPTLTTPAIASFVNATHTHADAAGGGTLAEAAFGFTDITTNNASSSKHGLQAKLSGNAYDFAFGDGSYGKTLNRGTVSASDPWSFTQTWNNSAVHFRGLDLIYTDTASLTSTYFRVLTAGGSTCVFSVYNTGTDSLSCLAGIDNAGGGHFKDMQATRYTTSTGISAFNFGGMEIDAPSTNSWTFGRSNGTNGLNFMGGAVPTLTSGFGTGASIVGTNSIGRITIGTSPSGTATLTFVETFGNIPVCNFLDETSGVYIPNVPTTTNVVITGTLTASDKVSYTCLSFRVAT